MPTRTIGDERVRTRIVDGEECFRVAYTDSCSGCCESEEGQFSGYRFDAKAGCHVGGGCHECGYTGKRRVRMWIPIAEIGGAA